ncbi:MAG: hypothetical protein ACE5HO_14265 [bacterium]
MTENSRNSVALTPQAFKWYGWVGLLAMGAAEYLLVRDSEFVKSWFTPIMWSGYILFADALIFKARGHSLISNRLRQFLFMLPYSVACWLIFEAYNLHLHNWAYVGLPQNVVLRYWGYFWAFATIFPGVLLTSELIDLTGLFDAIKVKPFSFKQTTLVLIMSVGCLFLVLPIVLPANIAAFLFGPVWMGFVFFLDPVNYFIGAKSLFRELESGRLNKLLSLFLAGLICGLLWEFWNYWATAKWVYTFPYLSHPKLFEMPLIGFVGFLPFAVEVYVMWEFAAKLLKFSARQS